jgi:hypothetical protein
MDNLRQVENTSVQEHWDAKKNQGPWEYLWWNTGRGPLLPAWGTRERERQLRLWYRNEYNNIGQDAISGLVKKIQSTQWNITGDRNAKYYHELLLNADFGDGWSKFISRMVTDFARQDLGSFVEIIAPGSPLRAPTGKVVGVATLDSLRCYPTGDPEYPVVYYDRLGKLHLMHRTRVYQFVDMPDKDDYNPGYGLSALSRAIKIVNEQMQMGKYIATQLDDQPAPGILVASNISDARIKAILNEYNAKQHNDAQPALGRQLVISSLDTANPAKIESVQFSTAPQNWKYEEYNNLHVNAWAAALGVDVQEIWQLTGGNIGSAGQSEVLHAKSEGRTYGALLTEIERFINLHVLPPNLKFEFKRRDASAALKEAEIAAKWVDAIAKAGANITPDEARRMYAAVAEIMKDAITDEKGVIVSLPDNDVQPDGTTAGDTDLDSAEQTNVKPTGEQAVVDDGEQAKSIKARIRHVDYGPYDMRRLWDGDDEDNVKAIQSTRLDFEGAFEDVLAEARAGNVTKARFGTLLRGLIARYGKAAYRDGLIDGGVTDGATDSDDDSAIALLIAEQSPYVRSFVDTVYTTGITDGEAVIKPELWYNGSVSPFYDAGRYSADKNGSYIWQVGLTEHCKTCARMNGQVHRLKNWQKSGYLPRARKLACKGWLCKCSLVKTKEPTRGAY